MIYDWFCFECNKDFSSKQNFARHVRNKDKRNWNLSCTTCKYRTHDKTRLKIHIERMHNKLDWPKRFRCQLCNFCTNHSMTLKEHTESTHVGEISKRCMSSKQRHCMKRFN